MQEKAKTKAELEQELIDDISGFELDPLAFVLYAFPWGEPGTSLANKPGPRRWQKELLKRLGEKLQAGLKTSWQSAVQDAIASGHGIGKSALVSWIILWGMSTHEDTRGVVTAGTGHQLKTKTWAELAKWHALSINHHWFSLNAESFVSNQEGHQQTWRIDQVTWSKEKTEAFAGLHNEGKRILLIFDEASQIPDPIWEVSEGALTDANTQIMWFVFGNPTRNTGRFRRCFGDLQHRWDHHQIDSRNVEGTNKFQIDKQIADYGEDSDTVRVRVKGQFPRASSLQFISTEVVNDAMHREPISMPSDPLIMGVDIARGGDDNCAIVFRKGRDAKSIPATIIPGSEVRDSMKFVSKLTQIIDDRKPDAVFFDGTGVGGPIGDRVKQLGYKLIEVQFGGESPNPKRRNMRAHMWAEMREWLETGAIPYDVELEADLTSPEFHHDAKDKIVLESKEDMKKRGLASPDHGDAIALTFAEKVAPLSGPGSHNNNNKPDKSNCDHDPFANF